MVSRSSSLSIFLLLLSVFICSHTAAQSRTRTYSQHELESLERKATNGDVKSEVKLGIAYQYGAGVQADTAKAEMWLKRAAGMANPQAQTQLGLLYLNETFVKSHAGEAERWFLRAAASDFAPAEYDLGLMHKLGIGASQNRAEAERWFRKAAKDGLAIANTMLAMMLIDEPGSDNQQAGFQLLQTEAQRGKVEAENLLGVCYELGKGTSRDLTKAVEWYRRAAEGSPNAMNNLGRLYYFGEGVSADVVAASQWLKRACDAGEAHACGELAQLFANGESEQPDVAVTYAFATIGGRQSVLEMLAGRITDDERKTAMEKADRWTREHPVEAQGQFALYSDGMQSELPGE